MKHVGERVDAVSRLDQRPPGVEVGLALHFQEGSVGVADLGDELVVAPWPDVDWERWNVSRNRGVTAVAVHGAATRGMSGQRYAAMPSAA